MTEISITSKLLESSLRAMRRGKSPEADLLSIAWNIGSTAEKNSIAFEDLLHELAWQAYASLRQIEGMTAVKPGHRQAVLASIQDDFRSGNGELAAWSALYHRYLSGIEISVSELSQAAGVVQQQFRRRLKQGLELLANHLTRKALEIKKTQAAIYQRLPLPDFTTLVGVQNYLDLLTRLFSAADGPRLVSLEGMGGIGKSALARAFIGLPETTASWDKLLWVSARQTLIADDGRLSQIVDPVNTLEDITARLCDQLGLIGMAALPLEQRLAGLRTALVQSIYLIVVDNLETVDEYQQLVPTLGELAGQSRFLITTRQTLREFPYVHTIPLAELDKKSAFNLLDSELSRRGQYNQLSKDDFSELYQTIGGHPLALKLVAAQLFLRPQSEILAGFRQAKGNIDNLYRYLYWQTWHSLTNSARRLLLSFLPSDLDGEDIEFLQLMSGQPLEEFYTSLKELAQFSLLEINGQSEFPLYRLHSLTTTFLRTDILHLWDEKSDD